MHCFCPSIIVYDSEKDTSEQKKRKNINVDVRQKPLERTYDEWKIDDYVFTNKNKS